MTKFNFLKIASKKVFAIKKISNYKRLIFGIFVAVSIILSKLGFQLINISSNTMSVSQIGVEEQKQEITALIKNFGNVLKLVSLTAPDDVVAESIKEYYSDFITPELLAIWQSNPQNAPGRILSSPWPDRIDVINIETDGDDAFVVTGEIIEVTSTEQQSGDAAAKYPVEIRVIKQNNRWLISKVEIIE